MRFNNKLPDSYKNNLVRGKDIKRGITYYLTADCYGYANTPVKYHGKRPAKDYVTGLRGNATVVISDTNIAFLILPNDCVFKEKVKIDDINCEDDPTNL